MRRPLGILFLALGLAIAPWVGPSARASDAGPGPADAVPGQLLVAVDAPADLAVLADLVHATRVELVPFRPDLAVVSVAKGSETTSLQRIATDGRARWAERNGIARATGRPNDPLYTYQWHLAPRSTALGGADWEPINGGGVTGAGVTVAVVDSGVTANEDLDGVIAGADLVDDDGAPLDAVGHGTHVAGTIAQSTNNSIGTSGVAPDATILPVRVLDATGVGTTADIIGGIAYASQQHARVINLSIGSSGDFGMCEAVAKARTAGAVVVASAGNEAKGVAFPAKCAGVIAVSATTRAGQLAPYSNFGPEVTLAAPGGDNGADIDADGRPDGILQYTFISGKGGYSYWSGTSMAAPHVSGAAALLLSVDPKLTPDQVRDLLVSTAWDLGTPGVDTSFGAGVLDIARAVSAAQNTPAPLPVPSVPPLTDRPSGGGGGDSGAGSTPSTRANPSAKTSRVAGADRFATSAAASRAAFSGGAQRAYLASGRSFADALAAGAIAGLAPGPILLTDTCSLPPVIGTELARLGPSEVVVIGGEAAVCSAVAAQAGVKAQAPFRRIAGTNRYATAAALSQDVVDSAKVVYLANGLQFADSLAGGSAASVAGGPLLLTAPCELPAEAKAELARIAPKEVIVVGGPAAVCDAVVSAAKGAAHATTARRIAGADRFATSALLAKEAGTVESVLLASGTSFPDGLSAGGLAATQSSPLLLVPACGLPTSVRDEISRLGPDRVTVIGGKNAVCEATVEQVGVAAGGS